MPILTPVYRSALFMKTKDFDVSSLAELPRATKSGDGFIIRLGSKSAKCLVRPLAGKGIVVIETDDSHTRKSAARELQIFSRAKGKTLERVALAKSKALELLRSFENDHMVRAGKVTVFYGDMGTRETRVGPRQRYRTKIAFNVTNANEAKKVSDDQAWEIRGYALTLTKGDRKHYAFVFFDRRPTCKITRVGRPMDAGLHEELGKRLVDLM